MPADSGREYLDPFENVLPGFFAGPIALMMHVFRVQHMEEAFHHGIVPAVPAPIHTRRQAVLGEQFAVRGGGVLGSSVRMMHHAGRRASMFYGHGERRRSQLLRQAAPPPPGNDPTRVEIEHHRQIEPALGGPNVGNTPGPHPIRSLDRELAIEGIFGHGPPMIRLGGGAPPLDGLGSEAVLAYQPSHTMLADTVSLLTQRVPDAGTARNCAGLDGSPGFQRAERGCAPTGGSQAVCARRNSPPPTRPGRGTSAEWKSDGRAPGSRDISWGFSREERRRTC